MTGGEAIDPRSARRRCCPVPTGMRVLLLLPYSPIPPTFGGALRNYHLLKHLVRRHDVTVLTYGTPEVASSLAAALPLPRDRIRVVPMQWTRRHRRLAQLYALSTGHSFFHLLVRRSRRMQEALDELLSEHDFDLVQTEFTPMGSFNLRTDAVKVLDAHNVEYENHLRMSKHAASSVTALFYRREARLLIREEREACRRQDAVFVTSAEDQRLFDALAPAVPKFIIPNGVDTDYFAPAPPASEPASLVFTGMMAYVPNHDGMRYFLDEIFPLVRREVPAAKVYIVGSRPPAALLRRASDGVVVTGYVEDVRPFVARASAYVVPLRMGSGTRLKILEALAMKRPVVTTSIGCEGLAVSHGESALVADEPLAFARQVIDLLRDDELRKKLTRAGYDLVREQYDWSVVHRRVEEAYEEIRKRAFLQRIGRAHRGCRESQMAEHSS